MWLFLHLLSTNPFLSTPSQKRLNEYASSAKASDEVKIRAKIGGMNRGPIKRIWYLVLQLWTLVCDPSVAWTAKAMAIGALLYLISPIDAVPDIIPIVGLADDVGVISAAVSALAVELKKYKTAHEQSL